jgi:magnesium transporter
MSASLALVGAYLATHPQDVARSVERLPVDDVARLLGELPAESGATLLAHLAPAAAAKAIDKVRSEVATDILEQMRLEHLAPLLRRVGPAAAERFVDALSAERAQPARALLAQIPGTAGAVMDPEILTVPLDATVADARALIDAHPDHLYYYLYAVDTEHRLAGVLDIAELMQAAAGPLRAIVKAHVVALPAAMPLKAVFAHAAWRDFDALPVVTDDRRFLGALRHRRVRQLLERDNLTHTDDRGVRTVMALGEVYWLGLCGLLQGIASAASEPAPDGGRS